MCICAYFHWFFTPKRRRPERINHRFVYVCEQSLPFVLGIVELYVCSFSSVFNWNQLYFEIHTQYSYCEIVGWSVFHSMPFDFVLLFMSIYFLSCCLGASLSLSNFRSCMLFHFSMNKQKRISLSLSFYFVHTQKINVSRLSNVCSCIVVNG